MFYIVVTIQQIDELLSAMKIVMYPWCSRMETNSLFVSVRWIGIKETESKTEPFLITNRKWSNKRKVHCASYATLCFLLSLLSIECLMDSTDACIRLFIDSFTYKKLKVWKELWRLRRCYAYIILRQRIWTTAARQVNI